MNVRLSRQQQEVLALIYHKAHFSRDGFVGGSLGHYRTRSFLQSLGLIGYRVSRGPRGGRKVEWCLTEQGKRLAFVIGETIEGTSPVGNDADGNQIRALVIGGRTFTWSF